MKRAALAFISGFVFACVFTSAVYSQPIQKEISAVFENIKIYVNGTKLDPRDSNNNSVEPFIYNGTTYLPVRAVANALGMDVQWDGKLKSVYIGSMPANVSGDDTGDSSASLSDTSGITEISGLQIFPLDNFWNTRVDDLPVNQLSDSYINSIGRSRALHPDFGTVWDGNPIGIPYNVVSTDQPKVNVTFDYADESDNVPYPIPTDPKIEAGSDRHLLILQKGANILYELYDAQKQTNGSWHAGSGAVWHLDKNEKRPPGWTSADASGLAILPGLARYDEVYDKGEINHALRVTINKIQKSYILPASHTGGTYTASTYPPMGLRLRLKKDFDISSYDPHVQVILKAMKKYGLVVADVGSDMYISGSPDEKWDDEILSQLRKVTAGNFEAVYTGDPIKY